MFQKLIKIAFFKLFLMSSFSAWGVLKLSFDDAFNYVSKNNTGYRRQEISSNRAQLDYDSAWIKYYFPAINLKLSSDTDKTIGKISGSEAIDLNSRSHGYPSSTSVSLELGEYNLFSFFQDYKEFRKSKMSYDSSMRSIQTSIKGIKNDLVKAYFTAVKEKNKMEVIQKKISFIKAIHQLLESREKIGKASESDVQSIKLDLDQTLRDQEQIKADYDIALSQLKTIMVLETDEEIKLTTPLTHKRLMLSQRELIDRYQRSPEMADKYSAVESAKIDLDLVERKKVPLPTLKVKAVTWLSKQTYSDSDSKLEHSIDSGSSSAAGNIELNASLSWTLPLWGEKGWVLEKEVIQKEAALELAQMDLKDATANAQNVLVKSYVEVKKDEKQIESLEASRKESNNLVQKRMEEFIKNKLVQIEFKKDLETTHQIEIDLNEIIYKHLEKKIELFAKLGADFENE